ncbi:peptidoglycan DD-metalloendopeptidase family protein [Biomaibacter acetigenes]|uniref:peptidoglycan DD-metalloendopeptidase family protein n=1 Tax=Biomaibacter acetigenes TaxID=2316383 RepID=UPI0013CE6EFB|nr:peptidoglycan DD-metalloendopeptidase family protein [Biomaibacter acetigenes]
MKLPRLGGFYYWGKVDNKKKILIAALCCTLAVFSLLTYILNRSVYAISVDGKTIGNVSDSKIIDKIKDELRLKYQDRLGADIEFIQDIQVTPVRALGQKVDTEQELVDKLNKVLSVRVKAVAIDIDGQQVALVKDKATADAVLQGIKDYYVNMSPGELVKIEVSNSVKLVEKFVNPDEIITAEAAKNLILKGTLELATYKVKQGDTLWTIAKEQNMPLDDLIKANPQLKSENKLALGEVINLKSIKPLLDVTVTKKVTYQEPLAFETQVVKDDTMWKWDQKVKQPGENGTKEVAAQVVYKNGIKVGQEVLSEKVLKEPVTRIVARGTRAEVAFRGSGRFLWPSVGKITSPFGRRGREFHTGIDVAADRGTPIRASNSGTVTFAGRKGSYGNLVIINHGGGFETYYAHASSILVSVGDKVEKGQQIATVGTTGRTTGPHVHFEVRLNGNPQNPLSYLNK